MDATKLIAPLLASTLVLSLAAATAPPTHLASTTRTSVDDRPSATTGLDLKIPEFRGLEPSLRLGYDATSGNGWLGVGWSMIGLSNITRVGPRGGTPGYTDADLFYLDGVRLIPCAQLSTTPRRSAGCEHSDSSVGTTPYAAMVESYQRISFVHSIAGDYWLVWDRNGKLNRYEPRLSNSPPLAPASWHLALTTDALGNSISYAYWQDNQDHDFNSQEYLDHINYGATSVKFISEQRPDQIDFANGRGLATTRSRLKTVLVSSGGENLRAYRLSYDYRSTGSSRSLLKQVQEYGNDVQVDQSGNIVSGSALPARTFETKAGPAAGTLTPRGPPSVLGTGPTLALGSRQPVFGSLAMPPTVKIAPYLLGDVNGDGRTDYVSASFDEERQVVHLGVGLAGVGLGADGAESVALPQDIPWPESTSSRGFRTYLGDVNGDGAEDLIMQSHAVAWPTVIAGSPLTIRIYVALSNRDGTFKFLPQPTKPPASAEPPSECSPIPCATGPSEWIFWPALGDGTNCQVGDANGDRLSDLVCVVVTRSVSVKTNQLTWGTPRIQVGTMIAQSGAAFSATLAPAPDFSPNHEAPELSVGDTDGDALSDVMLAYRNPCPDSAGKCGTLTFTKGVSHGDGAYDFATRITPFGGQGQLQASDFDGDGRADFFRVAKRLSGGSGHNRSPRYVVQTIRESTGAIHEESVPEGLLKGIASANPQITVGDADGDGSADLILALRMGPHGVTPCAPAIDHIHPIFIRVLSNSDGSFQWPTSLSQCTPLTTST